MDHAAVYEDSSLKTIKNPLRITCRACGAPVVYDIGSRNYGCSYCGTKMKPDEVVKRVQGWRKFRRGEQKQLRIEAAKYTCKTCGAVHVAPQDAVTAHCDFCGGTIIREEFLDAEDFPEAIIPFELTKEEAKKRLLAWCREQAGKPEAGKVQENIESLEGYYLPYRMIRGSIAGSAYRDRESMKFRLEGFLDGVAVNTSTQFNNLDLDAAEPFDWEKLQAFDAGFITKQRVKLNDMSDTRIEERVVEETEVLYRRLAAEKLEAEDAEFRILGSDFIHVPALVPIYMVRLQENLFAFVNGQTGKISVPALTQPQRSSRRWLLEPVALTVLFLAVFAVTTSIFSPTFLLLPCLLLSVFNIWRHYLRERNNIVERVIYTSEDSSDRSFSGREKGEFRISDSVVQFIEPLTDGRSVPVALSFCVKRRVQRYAVRTVLMCLAPQILAVPYALYEYSSDEAFVAEVLAEQSATLGDIIAGSFFWFVVILVPAIKNMIRFRTEVVYETPTVYELLPDGTRKRLEESELQRDFSGSLSDDEDEDEEGVLGFIFRCFKPKLGCLPALLEIPLALIAFWFSWIIMARIIIYYLAR